MHTHSLPSLQRILGVTLAALLVAGLFQNVIGNAEEHGSVAYLGVMLLVNGTIASFLFLRFIPRAVEAGPEAATKRATILGILALITFPAFWLGLPLSVGPAAVVLGLEARKRGAGAGATFAVVVGALAILAAIGITIMDELA